MRPKLIFIIAITVLLTAFFILNSEPVLVNLLFTKMMVSKLTLLPGMALVGFISGYIMGRSGNRNAVRQHLQKYGYGPRTENNTSSTAPNPLPGKTLSREDEDYLR